MQNIITLEVLSATSEKSFSLDELVFRTKKLFETEGLAGFVGLILGLTDERICTNMVRDIHLIDFESGVDTVWYKLKLKDKIGRGLRKSTLWQELSQTKLGPMGTGGRLATEKLEKAIKMHCPLPRLQPLITR